MSKIHEFQYKIDKIRRYVASNTLKINNLKMTEAFIVKQSNIVNWGNI